jgi:hypothetical protein
MRALLASVVALCALSGCGTETEEPGEPAANGEWTQQRIGGRPGADSPVGFAADADDVLVVVLGEKGVLQSHLSVDGGDFEAGEPIEIDGGGYPGFADPVRLDGTWWLVGTGGLVGEGNDETIEFAPRVLRSDDGLTWEPVEVSGIPKPVDLNAVVAVDGTLVAVGAKRNGVDTGGSSFEAAAWRSEDGSTWTESELPGVVPLPDYEDESSIAHVAVTGDRILAGGGLSGRAQIWSSDDAGVSWVHDQSTEVHTLYQVGGLVAEGSTVVVSGSVKGSESGSRILRSADGGATYAVAADQPTADGEGYGPLWSGGGHFFTIGRPGFDSMGDPGRCYADLDSCFYGDESDVTLLFSSDDGDGWSVVDLTSTDVNDEIIGLTGTASGRTLLAHLEKGVVVSAWPARAALPVGEVPAAPERVELVTVPEGEDPEPGVTYHAPLYIHCGMGWLYLGDTPWQRTDGGPEVETGAGDDGPEGWPVAGQTIYGYATLDADGVVEYAVGPDPDDEVIATYEQTDVQPPGCD